MNAQRWIDPVHSAPSQFLVKDGDLKLRCSPVLLMLFLMSILYSEIYFPHNKSVSKH